MRRIIALLALCFFVAVNAQAAFLRADVTELTIQLSASSVVTGIHFSVTIRDDATTETKDFQYLITNSELAGLPASGLARRAAIIAIIKRETKAVFLAWVADRAARVATNQARDVNADLGTTQLTNTDVTNPTP